jgi:beta-N-acetylhexosaminidase
MGKRTDRRPLGVRAARRGLALALALLTLVGCASVGSSGEQTSDPTPASTQTAEATSTPSSAPASTPTPTPSPTQEELWDARAEAIMDDMTLHEKVCQLFVIYPEAITGVSAVISAGSATQKALEQWPVAGFLYDKKNLNTRQQVTEMLTKVQTLTKIPLILTCDEEGGRVNRLMSTVGTTWVGPMLDYKDDGTETAFANAQTIASDLISCGFNTDLAPVADVWSNPENTVIGDRAYSDDFEQAALLVAAAVEGFHAGGAACTLKHFPGHGNTSADSHYGAVYVERTLEELRENELLPFQAGIDAGADMVMIGHLIVSDMDDEPAPFSYAIVTQLLRQEMGFTGVVITDGLQMKAMTDSYTSGEIAVKAVQAGVDLLLCPQSLEQAVTALEDAVESGELSESRIDESVQRILLLKLRQGILE